MLLLTFLLLALFVGFSLAEIDMHNKIESSVTGLYDIFNHRRTIRLYFFRLDLQKNFIFNLFFISLFNYKIFIMFNIKIFETSAKYLKCALLFSIPK